MLEINENKSRHHRLRKITKKVRNHRTREKVKLETPLTKETEERNTTMRGVEDENGRRTNER